MINKTTPLCVIGAYTGIRYIGGSRGQTVHATVCPDLTIAADRIACEGSIGYLKVDSVKMVFVAQFSADFLRCHKISRVPALISSGARGEEMHG